MAIIDRFDLGRVRRDKPEELANAFVFLSSPEAFYISSKMFEVDDGVSAICAWAIRIGNRAAHSNATTEKTIPPALLQPAIVLAPLKGKAPGRRSKDRP